MHTIATEYSDAGFAADLIREARVHLGLSEGELAMRLTRRLGRTFTAAQVSRWQRGETDPSLRAYTAMRDMARSPIPTIRESRDQEVANAKVRDIFTSRKELRRLLSQLARKGAGVAPALLAVLGIGTAASAAWWKAAVASVGTVSGGLTAAGTTGAVVGGAMLLMTVPAVTTLRMSSPTPTASATPGVEEGHLLYATPSAPAPVLLAPRPTATPRQATSPVASSSAEPSPAPSASPSPVTAGPLLATPAPAPTVNPAATPVPEVVPTPVGQDDDPVTSAASGAICQVFSGLPVLSQTVGC